MTYLNQIPMRIFAPDGSEFPDAQKIGLHGRVGHLPGLIQAGGAGSWTPYGVSASMPYRIVFDISSLTERRRVFRARVALDQTSAARANASLLVYADSTLIYAVPRVRADETPRVVEALVPVGAKTIVLVAAENETFTGLERAHTIWMDARLEDDWAPKWKTYLGDISVDVPKDWQGPFQCETCLITATTPGYLRWTDNFLGSLWANGEVRDASLVLFAGGMRSEEDKKKVQQLGKKYGAQVVTFELGHRENITSKLGATAAPYLFDAKRYLALDGDMVVLRSLKPLLVAIDAMPEAALGFCREWNLPTSDTLERHVTSGEYVYYGSPEDADFMRMTEEERECRLIANMGVYGGKKQGFLGLENLMRSMLPEAAIWEFRRMPSVTWREQAIMNRAAALLGACEFDPSFNVQLLTADINSRPLGGEEVFYCGSKPVSVLHFNGNPGKKRYPELQTRFLNVASEPRFRPMTEFRV